MCPVVFQLSETSRLHQISALISSGLSHPKISQEHLPFATKRSGAPSNEDSLNICHRLLHSCSIIHPQEMCVKRLIAILDGLSYGRCSQHWPRRWDDQQKPCTKYVEMFNLKQEHAFLYCNLTAGIMNLNKNMDIPKIEWLALALCAKVTREGSDLQKTDLHVQSNQIAETLKMLSTFNKRSDVFFWRAQVESKTTMTW